MVVLGDGDQSVPLGVRVTTANAPDKIRALLPNGGYGYLFDGVSDYFNSFDEFLNSILTTY